MITFDEFKTEVSRVEGSYRFTSDDPKPEWVFEDTHRPLFPSMPSYRACLLDDGDQTIISYYASGTWWVMTAFNPLCSLMSNGNSLYAAISNHRSKINNLADTISATMEEGQSIPPYLRRDCLTFETFRKAVMEHAKTLTWEFKAGVDQGDFIATCVLEKYGRPVITVEHVVNGVNADWTVTVNGLVWGYGNYFLAAWEMARKNSKESRIRLQCYRIVLK